MMSIINCVGCNEPISSFENARLVILRGEPILPMRNPYIVEFEEIFNYYCSNCYKRESPKLNNKLVILYLTKGAYEG